MENINQHNLIHIWDSVEFFDISFESIDFKSHKYVSAEQSRLIEFFKAKKGEEKFLLRSHIKPEEITRYLPNIMLLDIPEGTDYQTNEVVIRLTGTSVDSYYGNNTGKKLKELKDNELKKHWENCIKRTSRTAQPVISRGKVKTVYDREYSIVNLIFPLSNDGKNISQFLLFVDLNS